MLRKITALDLLFVFADAVASTSRDEASDDDVLLEAPGLAATVVSGGAGALGIPEEAL